MDRVQLWRRRLETTGKPESQSRFMPREFCLPSFSHGLAMDAMLRWRLSGWFRIGESREKLSTERREKAKEHASHPCASQQWPWPVLALTPSLPIINAITMAARGSAHHQPSQ